MKDHIYMELIRILPKEEVKKKERLKYHTSLHIGGEADYLVTPAKTDEIKAIISLCKQEGIPYYIMGNGSNILVSDQGYRGLIMKLGAKYSKICIDEEGYVIAQTGILLSRLANEIAVKGFTGFEFAAGIPGSLGGAVTMNAGAYDGDMKQCITYAKVMDEKGDIHKLSKDELELGYRTSILQRKKYILLEAELKLEKGNADAIRNKIQELNALRRSKQPLEQYSVGSTFKRPQGHYAGKLINEAGLCGYQVGGAAVSEKHCGFVINKENASAEDFKTVINHVIDIVYDKFGVMLEPEVKFVGEFRFNRKYIKKMYI